MTINFNREPYYDNFDETKKFYRILFKPGYAVQARELTQLQTALQDQIKKFGDNIFKDGTIILGGQRTFESDLTSIKLEATYSGSSVDVTLFQNAEITGATSGTKAFVKLAEVSNLVDPSTLIVKITSGDAFVAGENISFTSGSTTVNATIQTTTPFNNAMLYSVDSGIFYVNGHFVYHAAQTIAVDKYSNVSSKSVGFVVNDNTVTYEDDDTLLDNAQGTFNYAAPGADRYQIDLVLSVKNVGDVVTNFLEIARITNGRLIINEDKTIYSEIGKEMARRTFDESGDYTVKEWPIQVTDDVTVPADASKFTIALDPGKAYIKGFEFETVNQSFLTLDRARDVETADNLDVSISYGNYVYVDNVINAFDTTTFSSVNLLDQTEAVIGTAKVRYFKYASVGTVGTTAATYRMYLFDIVMSAGKYFKDVEQIFNPTNSAISAISLLSKVGGVSGGDVFLSGTDSVGLVFPLNNQYIESLADQSDYQFQRTYTSVGFSSGTVTYSTANSKERFVGPTGSAGVGDTIADENYHVVVTSVGTSSFTVGQVLRFNAAAGRKIELGDSIAGSTQSITFNVNASVSFTATIICTINANAQTQKTKVLSDYTKKVITTTLNTTLGGKDSLGVSDLYGSVSVYNIGNNDGSTVTVNGTTGVITWNGVVHTDVTSNYVLDNGQRSEYYDHGNLILSGTAPVSTDNLLVVYRNFTDPGTSGFYSRDSYSVPYENIPTFTDPSTSRTYQLRDCIDFRPRRVDGSTAFSGAQIASPSSTFQCDYSYYLARMDRIIAMPDKQFVVKKGVPAVNPVLPANDTNGMVIYDVVIPPYTVDVGDVLIKYQDNKRYTMRDIGKLDKRIKNLEYYTQLSLLEKQAKDTSIPDSSNFEKFKNGFAVDPFTSQDIFASGASTWATRRWGWWNAWFNGSNNWNSFGANNYNENSLAEASNIDFNAAIDPVNQELRAPFSVGFLGFNASTLTNTAKEGDLVTLDYTEEVAINQLLASTYINVNPFNVIRFVGSIALNPSFDNWVDTLNLPVVNKIVDVRAPDLADTSVWGSIVGSGNAVRVTSSSTSVVTNVLSSQSTSLGASVVDVQYIPFIRENVVIATGSLFKPNTTMFSFVENTPIDAYIKPLTVVTVQNLTGSKFVADEDLTFTGGVTAIAAMLTSPLSTDSTKRLLYIYNESALVAVGNTVTGANGGTATVTAVAEYNIGDSFSSDEHGNIAVAFFIPANTFKTGERTIRFIDNSNNDIEAQESFGEAKYSATGLTQSKQETILTTRNVQNQRVTTLTGQRFRSDPVAETFTVDTRSFPAGMHVSSVDLYFRTKSTNVPVTIQIRRTVNGYPESFSAIPFAEVTVMPENVSVSANASAATKFTFPSPVHLAPGDYAIVVMTNSSDYQVYVSEMGQALLNGNGRVDKQPYLGSLFKSQNASTWEPDQNQDLMFAINRAEFVSTGTALFEIQDPSATTDYQTLFTNVSSIAPAGTSISWEAATYVDGALTNAEFSPININQDINFAALKRIQAKAGLGFASLILRATLTTTDSAVSPAVDLPSLAVVSALNEINNDTTGETSQQGGNALAKYITKPVTLASGFEASNLCVTIDVNKPSGTDIKVYFKSLPTEKVTPISEESWVEMVQEVGVPNSVSEYEYREHRFFPDGAFNSFGVPQNNPVAARFNTFQVKIVMLSTTKVLTPKVKDLRIIALDS